MVSLNSILYIVVSAFAGIVATALYDTFRTPYPVNRLDFFIRKHLKKGKINGTNFIFERTIEIKEAALDEIFNMLKCGSSGQTTDIFNKITLSNVKLSIGTRIGDKITFGLKFHKIHAKLELSLSLNRIPTDYDEDEEKKVTITIQTIVDDWNYKAVKGLIYDSKEITNQIMDLIRKQYKNVDVISDIVFFDTKKQPHILSYLNELQENSQNKVSLKINEYMNAIFYNNKCEFINVRSDSDMKSLLDAIIWYV